MDNFDLKKYLVENKVTTTAQMLSEVSQAAMMEMAQAVKKYYDHIQGVGNTSPEELADDFETIINDVDNRGNEALKATYEQIMNQPFRKAKQDINKIWELAEEIESNDYND